MNSGKATNKTANIQEQFDLFSSTRIVVGVHGDLLTHILWCKPETVVIEVPPKPRADRTYEHLARMTGLAYIPVESVGVNHYGRHVFTSPEAEVVAGIVRAQLVKLGLVPRDEL